MKPEQLFLPPDESRKASAGELEVANWLIKLFGLWQAELDLLSIGNEFIHVDGGAKGNIKTISLGPERPAGTFWLRASMEQRKGLDRAKRKSNHIYFNVESTRFASATCRITYKRIDP